MKTNEHGPILASDLLISETIVAPRRKTIVYWILASWLLLAQTALAVHGLDHGAPGADGSACVVCATGGLDAAVGAPTPVETAEHANAGLRVQTIPSVAYGRPPFYTPPLRAPPAAP